MKALLNFLIAIAIVMVGINEVLAQQNDDKFTMHETKSASYAQHRPKQATDIGSWSAEEDIWCACVVNGHSGIGTYYNGSDRLMTEYLSFKNTFYSIYEGVGQEHEFHSNFMRKGDDMVAKFPYSANARYISDLDNDDWQEPGWTLVGALKHVDVEDHWRAGVQVVKYDPGFKIPPYTSYEIGFNYKVKTKRTTVTSPDTINFCAEFINFSADYNKNISYPSNQVVFLISPEPIDSTGYAESVVKKFVDAQGGYDGSVQETETASNQEYTFVLDNSKADTARSMPKTFLCFTGCYSSQKKTNAQSAAFYVKDFTYRTTYYYSVTYINNDGNSAHNKTNSFKSTLSSWDTEGTTQTTVLVTTPYYARDGYDFAGWRETNTQVNPETNPSYPLVKSFPRYKSSTKGGSGPHTVYAVWKPIVTFLDAEGKKITDATKSYYKGVTPSKPSKNPTKSNTTEGDWTTSYIFDSWRNASTTGPDKDAAIVAVDTIPVTYYPRFRSYSKHKTNGGIRFEGYGWTQDAICAQIDAKTTFVDLRKANSLPVSLAISLAGKNPNTLFFVNSDNNTLTNTHNVVVKSTSGSTCDSLVVTDRYDFYNPEGFAATKAKYVRDGSSAGSNSEWGTLYLPFAFPNNDAVTYYALTDVEEERDAMIFETQTAATIPAYTPVIYKRVSGKGSDVIITNSSSSTVPATTAITKSVSQYGGYTLIGTLKKTIYVGDDFDYPDTNYATDETDDDVYYFKQDEFLHLEDDGRVTIPQYRCYFTRAKSASATSRDFSIIVSDQSGADDITSVFTDGANGKAYPIYDLTGRRVASPQKGHIYIAGGKKLIIK